MHNYILRNLLPYIGKPPIPVLMDKETSEYIQFSAELLGGMKLFNSIDLGALDLFAEPKCTSEELKGVLLKRPLRLLRIAVVITTRCTLKCPHCVHLNSHYKTRHDYNLSTVIDAIRSVLRVCDVDFIALLGGEPFLHQKLPEMILTLRDEPRLGRVSITTNGTLPASEPLLIALSHSKTSVFVSNYSSTLVPNTSELVATLTKHRINVHLADSTHQWADAGGTEPRGRDVTVLRGMYSRCLFASCPVILGSRLYVCPRNANAVNLGIISEFEGGGVELLNTDMTTLKARIIDEVYAREFVLSCNFCDFITPSGTQTLINRAT